MINNAYGMNREQAMSYFEMYGIYEKDSTTLAVPAARGMVYILDLEDDEVVEITKTCYFF